MVDSPFARPVRIRASLNLPAGFAARTMQDSMHLSPGRSESVEFRVSTPADWPAGRRLPVTVDLHIDGELWPEQAEALLIPRCV